MIDIDLREMRKAEDEDEWNKRIAPNVCPFIKRCHKCGRPINWSRITCECGERIKEADELLSYADKEMIAIAKKESEQIRKSITSLERHVTFIYIIFTVYMLHDVLYPLMR